MSVVHPALGNPRSVGQRRLALFDCVRLLEDLPASAVTFLDDEITPPTIAAGATGVIVEVYDSEADAYEVELTEPVPAVATLYRHQIERL